MLNALRRGVDGATTGTVLTALAAQSTLVVSGVIVARALGVYDRGLLAVLAAVATAAASVASIGLPAAVAFSAARPGGSVVAAWRAVRPILAIQAALLIVVPAGFVLGFGDFPERWMPEMAICAALAALSMLLVQYMLALLQGQQLFTKFNVSRLLLSAPYALGVAIAYMAGARSLLIFALIWTLGMCIAAAISSVVALMPIKSAGDPATDRRGLVAFGLKAQLGTSSPLETFNIDQIVIGAIGGPAVLGLYVVGYAFTNLPRLIAQSLGMVAFPRIAARIGIGGARRVAADAMLLTIVLVGVLVIALELAVGWLIPLLFGDAFSESVVVSRVLLVAAFFLGVRKVLGDALRGANEPMPATFAEIASWPVFAACVYPFTVAYGAVGAAGAYTASAAVSTMFLGVAAVRIRDRLLRAHNANMSAPTEALGEL